jgi:hypothetical protein
MTNVDRKIASRETTRVRVGHGVFSRTTIHTAKKAPRESDEVHRAGE